MWSPQDILQDPRESKTYSVKTGTYELVNCNMNLDVKKQVNVVIYFLLVKVQTMPMQWSCRQQKAVSVAFSEAISMCSCCCKLLMAITVLARKLPLLSSLPLNLVPYMWCMQSSGAARFWGPIISSNPEFWQNCLPGDGLGAALC